MGKRERLQKSVTRAISRQGNLAVAIFVTKITRGAHDVATDTFAETTTQFSVKSVPFNFKERKDTTQDIKKGDVEFLISAENLGFVPKVKDVFTTATGNKFEVIELEATPSAETAVMWQLQMRPTV